MDHAALREAVCEANRRIGALGLAVLTWGNGSGIDRDAGVIAIKPSGVEYASLTPESIVLVDAETGQSIGGGLRPSSDTKTHLAIYAAFDRIGGIVHTHSTYATAFAQAELPIPCLGTTHADHFAGDVPVVRHLTEAEIAADYEANTGKALADHFVERGLDPMHVPGALLAGHASFVWGTSVEKALENAIALEEIARIAAATLSISADIKRLPQHVADKHFARKHGPEAYYGQET